MLKIIGKCKYFSEENAKTVKTFTFQKGVSGLFFFRFVFSSHKVNKR